MSEALVRPRVHMHARPQEQGARGAVGRGGGAAGASHRLRVRQLSLNVNRPAALDASRQTFCFAGAHPRGGVKEVVQRRSSQQALAIEGPVAAALAAAPAALPSSGAGA